MVTETIKLSEEDHAILRRLADERSVSVDSLLADMAADAVRNQIAYENFRSVAAKGNREEAERIFAKWMKNGPE